MITGSVLLLLMNIFFKLSRKGFNFNSGAYKIDGKSFLCQSTSSTKTYHRGLFAKLAKSRLILERFGERISLHLFYLSKITTIAQSDEDQANTKHNHANDPWEVPIGPITRAKANKLKEELNGLVQNIWSNMDLEGLGTFKKHEEQPLIHLIQVQEEPYLCGIGG
jgi:hypothetical protein